MQDLELPVSGSGYYVVYVCAWFRGLGFRVQGFGFGA